MPKVDPAKGGEGLPYDYKILKFFGNLNELEDK